MSGDFTRASRRAELLLTLRPLLDADGILIDSRGHIIGPPFPDPFTLRAAMHRALEQVNLVALTPSSDRRPSALKQVRSIVEAILENSPTASEPHTRATSRTEGPEESSEIAGSIGTAVNLLDNWFDSSRTTPHQLFPIEPAALDSPPATSDTIARAANQLIALATDRAAFSATPLLLADFSALELLQGACVAISMALIGCARESEHTAAELLDLLLQ